MYPNWPIFVKTVSVASTMKQKTFFEAQEAFRKDVERAIGVFISRWQILQRPCRFMDREIMATVMPAS